ncbi:DNA gyrase inhibitor YacG [Piscinibacter aquaticus]|uniref:DNA gyrase inhibitor YacG n=1 Tax=Piscinibacter aquaticus TaxID=392597 RepID=A0A5C6U556_9BURK|nr:DNA gyrase inhibitor YacG [Piscinibacter aquaticus]
MTTTAKPRTVRCPACGGPSEYSPANAWRPFCCERCKNHDFGAWASESYRVADPAVPGGDAAEGDTLPRH